MSKRNIKIGDRIKGVRKAIGMNQTDFGKIFGLTSVAISRYERGRTPNGELLKKIADLGHVSVDWLLTGEEPYAHEKEKAAFVRDGGYLSDEEERLVELLRRNPELAPLLKKYDALKGGVAGLNMELVLSPETT